MAEKTVKIGKVSMTKIENETTRFPIPRPPFIGRYFIYAGKKYLFTHRHPKRQAYWSDDVPDPHNSRMTGAWIDTDKLEPCD